MKECSPAQLSINLGWTPPVPLSASQVRSNLQEKYSLLLLLILLLMGLLQSSVKDFYSGGGAVVHNGFSPRFFSIKALCFIAILHSS